MNSSSCVVSGVSGGLYGPHWWTSSFSSFSSLWSRAENPSNPPFPSSFLWPLSQGIGTMAMPGGCIRPDQRAVFPQNVSGYFGELQTYCDTTLAFTIVQRNAAVLVRKQKHPNYKIIK